ncbi:hypothetical protein O181_022326 [Austropuccinia psidii MF-1]|uniref:DNA primase large subunit n=1 Tax=Austropuccinia psidii MF-1 TaxID=1389203 RepID=A0A9Q3CCM8_9BASI|nr:hypothetical protein [Austropuccinia psidii MF-1]
MFHHWMPLADRANGAPNEFATRAIGVPPPKKARLTCGASDAHRRGCVFEITRGCVDRLGSYRSAQLIGIMFTTQSRLGRPTAVHSINSYNPRNNELQYPFRLNFYDQPPTSEITIEEFETWAIDRLKVLAEIENAVSRNKSFEELKPILSNRSKTYLPLAANTAHTVDLDQQRRKDHYSHFILRLAFCRSEELRNRFVNAETQLFRFKLETEDSLDKASFINSLKLDWLPVDKDKAAEIKTLFSKEGRNFQEDESYVQVDWTKVPDLVATRRVYLSGGYAYVASKDQASIILREFSSRLLKALEITSKHLPYLDEDDRVLPVLEHLSMNFLAGTSGSAYVISTDRTNGAQLTADMIDQLAKLHFPPCMHHLWVLLRKDKHLKYNGRQQLNLFLKGIGLPIEEALLFWRRAFCNITEEKFRKDYRYAVRHNYGLEGSRKNYQPKPCLAIIKDSVGPHESHGCPFKQFSPNNLTHYLTQAYGMSPHSSEMKDILEWSKTQHYHLACTTVFEHSHKGCGVKKGDGLGLGESVSHPNQYFDASYRLSKARETS